MGFDQVGLYFAYKASEIKRGKGVWEVFQQTHYLASFSLLNAHTFYFNLGKDQTYPTMNFDVL